MATPHFPDSPHPLPSRIGGYDVIAISRVPVDGRVDEAVVIGHDGHRHHPQGHNFGMFSAHVCEGAWIGYWGRYDLSLTAAFSEFASRLGSRFTEAEEGWLLPG